MFRQSLCEKGGEDNTQIILNLKYNLSKLVGWDSLDILEIKYPDLLKIGMYNLKFLIFGKNN